MSRISILCLFRIFWEFLFQELKSRPRVIDFLLYHFVWKVNNAGVMLVVSEHIFILSRPVDRVTDFFFRSDLRFNKRFFFPQRFLDGSLFCLSNLLGCYFHFLKWAYVGSFLDLILDKLPATSYQRHLDY